VETVQCAIGFLPQKKFVDRVRRGDQIALREEFYARKAGDAQQNHAASGKMHGDLFRHERKKAVD
jgi:hypothetical protein